MTTAFCEDVFTVAAFALIEHIIAAAEAVMMIERITAVNDLIMSFVFVILIISFFVFFGFPLDCD